MRIRKVELFGFKSFPDRTTIQFGRGISCVVGPNGCGKSNLLDAIKWCVGEQSAKALRGGEMTDVVFSGTEDRPALGFAEVSIALTAEDGEPFPGEYARLSELQVMRRLHRTGASEYFLAGQRCRRRDIVDLFLDTGVGTDLYSFMEQGSVGRIVHATAAERRALVEEAAGISKYKARREEAQSRLEATSAQLDRVADVADEMERRLKTLEGQVVKVARYRRLLARVRQLEICLALARFADLAVERRELQGKRRDAVARAERVARREAEAERERAERKAELDAVARGMETVRDRLAEGAAKLGEIEAAIAFEARHGEAIRQAGERARLERGEAERARTSADAEREAARVEVERLGGEIARAEEEKEALAEILRAERERIRNRREAAERAISEARVVFGERVSDARARATGWSDAARRAEDEALAALQARLDEALAAAEAERDARLREAEGKTREEVAALESAAGAERRERLAALDAARAEAWGAVEASREEGAALRRRDDALAGEEQRVSGRLEGLERLDRIEREHRIGSEALARRLREFPRLLDLLDARERADEDLIRLLGDRILLPVVREVETLRSIETSARAHGGTRVIWLPEAAGGTAVARMVGRCEVVDALDRAIERSEAGAAVVVVGPTGDRVDPDGVVHVGTRTEREHAALERRGERDTLAARLDTVRAEREALREPLSEAARRTEACKAVAEEADRAVREAEREGNESIRVRVAQITTAGEARIGAFRAEWEGRNATLRAERRSELERARATARARLASLGEEAERVLALVREEAEAALDAVRRAARVDESGLRELEVELARREGALGTLAERLRGAQARGDSASRRRDEADVRLRSSSQRVEEAERALREGRDAARRAAEERQARLAEREADEARIRSAREKAAALEKLLEGLDAELTRHGEEAGRARREADEADLRSREVQISVDAIRQRVEDRYLVSLAGMLDRLDAGQRVTLETDPSAREDFQAGRRLIAGIPPLEIPPGLLRDVEAIRGFVEDLESAKNQVQALGEVNLAAMQEYEEVSARHADLVAQRTDVEESVDRIRKAIAQMNRTCRQRFRDTFDRVEENFREIYPRLMGGGSARLSLTDEEDLLESGVEIYAQPPGKRLQILSLLSGGEKALTAIAMLLSLFRVKPSPFCILDEVDAPLDEANGARFNALLKEMSEDAQFILITHNRRTMDGADTLYGITMPTPGVSRLVSVRIGA